MKYYLDQTSKTLRKNNGFCNSRASPKTEDDVIRDETKYFKRCKIFFKEKK